MLQDDDAPLDVVIELSRAEDAFRYGELTYLVHREGGGVERAPLLWGDELQDDLAALGRPDPELRQRFGERLRTLLGQAEWGAREAQIAKALAEGRGVHVTIRSSAPELYRLPWELLTRKSTGEHLGELPGCLVRYEWPDAEAPDASPAPEGGRILFAWSAAGGVVPAADHLAALRRASAEGVACFDAQRDVLADVSLAALHDALSAGGEPVAVLHLLCHGGRLDAASESYGLVWNGASGGGGAPVLVDASALRRVLEPHRRTLRLVVLSSCYGGNAGAPGDALGAVALELHRIGIAAVVASRQPLSVPGSLTLTEALYRGLVVDLASLEEAFLSARGRLALDASSGDWASLQLYARAAAGGDTRPLVVRPFRGLLAFAAEHRRFLFGREAEIAEVVGDLGALGEAGRPRFLVVAGASGTGKSSMVLAGAAPRLLAGPGAGWELGYLRPGRDPEAALAAALGERRDPAKALLLVVDQLEEVFTATASAEARRRFVRRLWALAGDAGSGVHVVLTLRVDFIGHCGEITLDEAELRLDQVAYDERHRVFVAQMTRAQLTAAITGPARRVGLCFDPGLVPRLLDDAGGEPGALPLLEDTLDLLWQRRAGRVLTQAAYDAVGGLAGALHGRADQLVDGLDEAEKRTARRLLVRLVSVHGDEALATRRRALVEELRPGDAAEAERFDRVLEALVDARLLVRGDEGGKPSVEVAHEALIRRWARLGQWVREDRDELLQLEKIAGWVAEWKARGALLAAGQLAYAEDAAQRWPEDLGAEAKALIASSRAQAKRAQRVRRIVTWGSAAAAVVFALLGVFLGWEKHRADKAAGVATEAAGVATEQRTKALAQARKARDAARVAVAGQDGRGATVAALMLREVEEDPALAQAFGWLEAVPFSSPMYLTQRVFETADEVHQAAAWSPDGSQIVTGARDGTVRVWTAEGKTLHTWKHGAHGAHLTAAAWSPDGARIVTGARDGTVRVWTPEGKPLHTWKHGARLTTAAWSPDGARIVTAGDDGIARVWRVGGEPHEIELRADAPLHAVAWSPDGTRIVAGSEDGTAWVWNADGTLLVKLPHHADPVYAVAWSPNSKRVVTGTLNHHVLVWTLDDAHHRILNGHTGAIASVAWSDAGILSASWDGTVRVWNPDSPEPAVSALAGHTRRVSAAAWSPDRRQIVTASFDQTVRVWREDDKLAHPRQLEADAHEDLAGKLPGPQPSRDGKWVVTVTPEHLAEIEKADARGAPVATLVGHGDQIRRVAWSADGKQIVTASSDKTARVWDTAQGRLTLVLKHRREVHSASFDETGTHVWTGTDGGEELEWTVDPKGVLQALWLSTPYCLSEDDRRRLLNESNVAAEAAYGACMAMSDCLRDARGKLVEGKYPGCLAAFREEQEHLSERAP